MHKDPPPTLFEKPTRDIVLHGVITGFVISVVFFGAWSLLSANTAPRTGFQPPPKITPAAK